ncbi:hypothetical protein QFC22_004459 [Naganishia vaughanmartiniae]|uniref:Uncharacterized protein n=1 Tax=Naganishia vaughanmartiniae TaxID=1424756 RepID=A0ACC2X0M4_9TREE|nr:hypothetical protein QFC22_004459 [Naganishia vaughanmartiniae]
MNVSSSTTAIGRAVLRRQAVRQARTRRLPHATALTSRHLPPIPQFANTGRPYATAAIKAASGPAPTAEAISPLVDIPHAVIKLEGNDPLSRYESSVKNGVLRDDEYQRSIISKLQRLHDELKGYQPVEVPDSHAANGGWMSSLNPFGSRTPKHVPQPPGVPKGMYLYGDVGTGKTMLMDLFYHTLPPHLHPHRRRVHFHAFMVDVFRRVHAIKHGLPRETKGGKARRHKEFNPLEGKSDERAVGVERLTGGGLFEGLWGKGGRGRAMDEEDAIYEAARELAEEGRILCFDEFQVTDIVTAMILRQLLERMMAYGVVCVITSNRHPDELYQNGIQRTSFLPCIDMIKDRFAIVDLDSGTAASKDDPVIADRPLKIWGRTLKVPESTKHVARFSFNSLCGRPLSSADYLEITKNFGTIFVEEVGRMGLGEKDMARRFITFIDACYESKTRIFISSEVPIFQIFSDDDTVSTKSAKETNDHMRQVMDDLGLAADDVKTSSIFSGQEEIFAFARCNERLDKFVGNE